MKDNIETISMVQHQLAMNTVKFEKALTGYRTSMQDQERIRCKAIMDDQIGLIKQGVAELRRKGIHKQEVKVEEDYKQFTMTGSEESYAALKHDIQTLRDYNNS